MTRSAGDDGPAGPGDVARDRAVAEAWFADHGLPWFVDGVGTRVTRLLGGLLLAPVVLVSAAVAVVAGVLTARLSDLASGVVSAVVAFLLLLLLYAGGPLRVAVMARWAVRSTVSRLSLLLPLALRALPLLLLFMTFLFINTEVWQVAGSLSPARLAAVFLVFVALGAAFLVFRLPEEVRRVERAVAREGFARSCRGTPLAARAVAYAAAARDLGTDDEDESDGEGEGSAVTLSRVQRGNLVLVLLVAQALQVLVLALAVFAFFVGFGALVMRSDVVAAWVGGDAPGYAWWGPAVGISVELIKVSVFLSAFAAMYFTVYAVTDPGYRTQFFTHIDTELEQAVGVRAVYRRLLADGG